MAYTSNPFLLRTTDQTPDQAFVRLFSPKIIERLEEGTFQHGVHLFQSPPGGGKTTLLKAFTPDLLKAFWNARKTPDINDAYSKLVDRQVMNDSDGPQLLGVFLTCAAGYADLPPSASSIQDGLFRALLDCRIVLRTLRSLGSLLRFSSSSGVEDVRLQYSQAGRDLQSIPTAMTVIELEAWAVQRERAIYSALDASPGMATESAPSHVRFEGVLWLQSVRFCVGADEIAPKRLLMIDDLHKLRRKQRSALIEELIELRPTFPIWLAERSIAMGDDLISQGARPGRDLQVYRLDDIWSGQHRGQFSAFAQNVLLRRLDLQSQIPSGQFSLYLRTEFRPSEIKEKLGRGFELCIESMERRRSNNRYADWMREADELFGKGDLDALRALYRIRILMAREDGKRQLTLDLSPLPMSELDERASSQAQAAAEIFIHEDLKIPVYYGIDRLCSLATNNIDELLRLAAALYEGLRAKSLLRNTETLLAPFEQEKIIKAVAEEKLKFIPKNHTEGTRASRLLDALGAYCRERTFLPSAPYAPGVTGIRLSQSEMKKLHADTVKPQPNKILRRVLSECVAENLLFLRESQASTSREGGTVYYLNRTLCARFDLPLQTGG